jgi:hypothetical protein
MTVLAIIVTAACLIGLWLWWFPCDHDLLEEMRRGRQAEGPRRRDGVRR